jgi:hypothetical protein
LSIILIYRKMRKISWTFIFCICFFLFFIYLWWFLLIIFFFTKFTNEMVFIWMQDLYIGEGPSWPWSYGSWIYRCNQCQSPLMLWVRISIRARCTTLCDKVCQWHATGRWFSPGPPVSSTNKTDRHDITEILLKVVLNTIKQTKTI